MRWLGSVNCALVAVIVLVAAFFFFSREEEEYFPIIVRPEQKELPKSPYADAEEFFQELEDGPFCLKWVPPQMQLPDLREELLFYGKNGRPDSMPGKALFYFCLKGSQERKLVREGERAYLVYQGSYTPKLNRAQLSTSHMAAPKYMASPTPIWGEAVPAQESADRPSYVFSPDNQPTPLWFEVKERGEQHVEVCISMLDEKGALVTTPPSVKNFSLALQDFPKAQSKPWELGGHRVDTTLLVRQKARWVGQDIFLEYHGGDEYLHTLGKQRIDFLDGAPHCCFVQAGDFLIWKDGRWQLASDYEESQNYPLLVVKKIDEKIITFELWDTEGRGKVLLNLVHAKDHNGMPDLNREFKFVGAKTWAQFIVENRCGERMTLRPQDWLVLNQGVWQKLDTPELIDAYVNQSITGPLFILEKMAKQNGRQVLIGHLYNASRTQREMVELTSNSTTPLANFYRQMPIAPPIQPRTQIIELEGGGE